jgi:hypothetical protein
MAFINDCECVYECFWNVCKNKYIFLLDGISFLTHNVIRVSFVKHEKKMCNWIQLRASELREKKVLITEGLILFQGNV